MRSKALKQKLKSGELSLGSWISLSNSSIAEILAKAGFDWLVVDLEHSAISIDQAGELIRIIDLCGVTPLVRLTSNNPNQIKRVMDAGAHGIIVPMVNSPEDAEKAIASTRYGPKGNRGVGLARAQGYGSNFEEYLNWQAEEPIVVVQIEHINALSSLQHTLEVEGVDAFIIGPYDLSCSMGIPGEFNNPEFLKIINKIREIGLKVNCPSGFHIVEPDQSQLLKAVETGYKFIAYSVDIRMLDTVARNAFSAVRKYTVK